MSLKSAHRSWDDTIRACKALLQKAQGNACVYGKLVEDMNAEMGKGTKVDVQLQNQEVLAANGKVFNASEIEGIGEAMREMTKCKDAIKTLTGKINNLLDA